MWPSYDKLLRHSQLRSFFKVKERSSVHRDDVPAGLRSSSRVENDLSDGASIFTGRIVKIRNRRAVACKVSSAKRGGNGCFCSSSSNQRRYQQKPLGKVRLPSLTSFPLQILVPGIWEQCWDFTFSLFKCVSKNGCQIFTNNKQSKT